MKIAIDIQTTLGQPTGFGFYVSNLVRELNLIKSEFEFSLIRPVSEVDFSTPQRFIWDQFILPRRAMRAKAALLHQPCFSASFIFRGPVVVTIHDIISILYPENIPFASRMFYSKWMPFSYRKAAQIITISESTKKDITRVLEIPEKTITVIPLAVDERFKKAAPRNEVEEVIRKYGVRGNYILHLGTLEPRKNLGFLIEVFASLIRDKRHKDLNLVIASKKGWYYEGLFEKVKALGLEKRIIFTGYVDDSDKPALYKGAKIFAFPSLYEGFGLPPLEAMASGVPVVSSNTSSLPEVVGEAGILLSPKDKRGWVKAISSLCLSNGLIQKMKGQSKKQADKFSWETVAQKTIEVYRRALNLN